MQPLSKLTPVALARIRVLAADIDDTITTAGRLPPSTIEGLQALDAAGIVVGLVTGRSAGWAQALASYLPGVKVAVAENGLVAFDQSGERVDLGPPRAGDFGARLADNGVRLRDAYRLKVTPDDAFRLFERAFVRSASFDAAALAASQEVVDPDFEVVASSIHIHVRPRGWGKAEGLLAALQTLAPEACAHPDEGILFVGDSSNDRSLFARLRETSVGVRNVTRFLDELGADQPAFVTEGESAAGFAEVVRALLAARR
jgi:hydroxymethylpyrimidine pyrophosphatase-like HAD family hydrolase